MQRAPIQVLFLFVLLLLALALSGCGVLTQRDRPEVDLGEIFPAHLPSIGQPQRLDVDGNGEKEWLVFYHVDQVQDNKQNSPVTAAVYRPVDDRDSRLPPHLVPALLWLPGQAYPCFFTCEAEMRDVIRTDSPGKELVIQDKRDKKTVGVAIFRWRGDLLLEGKTEPGGFVPLGHFRGDSITIEQDKIEVTRRHNDRSDLAVQETYVPIAGRYYVQEVKHVDDAPSQPLLPQKAEVVFADGPPKKPIEVKLPEKLVLSFYQNFDDRNEIESYVTPAAWKSVVQDCPENVCGCASRREGVSHVMVKQIAYPSDLGPTTQVVVQVICVNKSGHPEPSTTLTWGLNRQLDNTWLLADVFRGGDEYLCPPRDCRLLGARE
jgi:hypothetical protein